MCARQNNALRGHRDDGPVDLTGEEPKHNDGNFRALLRLRIRGGDTDLKDHLVSGKRNATLVSKTIQNELIACAGKYHQRRHNKRCQKCQILDYNG